MRWLCVSLSIFMLYKAKDLLPCVEMDYSLRYIFTINSQSVLRMNSVAILRCDSAWAGVHANTAVG